MGVLTDDERATMVELLNYPNPQGLHPSEERWRDLSRVELSLRDERIRQLEKLNETLAAEVDRLRREYDEEVAEFNAGYQAAEQGLPDTVEPNTVKHDVWKCGYAWGAYSRQKQLAAEVDRQRSVVEAAQQWHLLSYYRPEHYLDHEQELANAIAAYEASREGADGR